MPFYSGKNVEKRSKLLKELMRTYTNNVLVNDQDEMNKVIYLNDIWQLDPHIKRILTNVLHQMVLLQANLCFLH